MVYKQKMMQDQNKIHRMKEIENQKQYRNMLAQQDKMRNRHPEEALKPYESPGKVSSHSKLSDLWR